MNTMQTSNYRRMLPLCTLLAALVGGGCATRRQLADVQPGMSMADVRNRFGGPAESFASPVQAGAPVEVTWYYNAYQAQRIFEWQTVPTGRRPGWRLEPGQTTVGIPYRRFEIIFHDGVVVGRAEFEPPPPW